MSLPNRWSAKPYATTLLSCVLTFVCVALSARQAGPDFRVLDSADDPSSESVFFVPFDGVALPVAAPGEPQTIQRIEGLFENAATGYQQVFGAPFDSTFAVQLADEYSPAFFPIYVSDDYLAGDTSSPLMSAEGPIPLFRDLFYLRAPAPLVLRSFISALDQPKKQRPQTLEAQLPELPISYAVASFHEAAQCQPWPVKQEGAVPVSRINRATPLHPYAQFFTTMARAKALLSLQEMGLSSATTDFKAMLIVADRIARAQKNGATPARTAADIRDWLGAENLRSSRFRVNDIGKHHRFADPLSLALMNTTSPEVMWDLSADNFNALRQLDNAIACSAPQFPKNYNPLLDALQDAHNAEAKRVGRTGNLRQAFLHGEITRYYLPQYAQAILKRPIEEYQGTFLEPQRWLSTLFPYKGEETGCVTIDLAAARWYQIEGELEPMEANCLRVKPATADGDTSFSLTVKISGNSPSQAEYGHLVVGNSEYLSTGILSRTKDVFRDDDQQLLKTWILNTEPLVDPLFQEPDGSKLIFISNVARRLSETTTKKITVDIHQNSALAVVTGVDRVQENGRKAPAVEYPIPTLPANLTTRVSFHLQSAEDYADPKLFLGFTYAPEMEGIMNRFASVVSNSTTPFSADRFPSLLPGGSSRIDRVQEQVDTVQSLADQLKKLQTNALTTHFGKTMNVVIEAPAPPPGFTGVLNDVLVSVNWEDDNGKPHDLESIGPQDMSADSTNEIYLNNGSLTVKHFERGLFVADFSAVLTDEPILAPMTQRRPHLNRDVAGNASGTLVATGIDVVLRDTREMVEMEQETIAGAIYDDIRTHRPQATQDARDRAKRNQSNAGASGSGNQGVGPGPRSLPACNCSCDSYWRGDTSYHCIAACKTEYLSCRTQPSSGNQSRLLQHSDAITYYWNMMGISTPQAQAASKTAIALMTEKEFVFLLRGVESAGGPKAP